MSPDITSQPPIPQDAKVVSIHQPHYLPWLGLIAKIACSDIFVFLDNVQFEKNGWQYRTRYAADGGLKFLSLPIRQQGIISEQKHIRHVELADVCAPIKHWKTLSQRYGKRPGWKMVASKLEAILNDKHDKLISLCLATTRLTLEVYGLKPQIIFSSDLNVAGQKGHRVINLVKAAGATHYLSGTGAKEYLEPSAFMAAGLGLSFQEFSHPVYPQSCGGAFAPAAFALEWFLEEPDTAVATFHGHLRRNPGQLPRCLA